MIGLRLIFFTNSSLKVLPEIKAIYPGIKGKTHGDKKLIKPAPRAINSSVIIYFDTNFEICVPKLSMVNLILSPDFKNT